MAFRLRRIAVTGLQKMPAVITFADGLNVLSGASDTGKSYIVELIDYMLGRGRAPRHILEGDGYARAALTIEAANGKLFTLYRELSGGELEYVEGDGEGDEVLRHSLAAKHSAHSDDNVSSFLLNLVGLNGKRIRKNERNQLQSLSFRNLAHLVIVDETKIIEADSPISTTEYPSRTVDASVFKLLLTGEDDSGLIAVNSRSVVKAQIEAQVALLDQLIGKYEVEFGDTSDQRQIEDEMQRISRMIDESHSALEEGRASLEAQQAKRNSAWTGRENALARLAEIDGLLERFTLLDEHYCSDLSRLRALAEAGYYFEALTVTECPLCGAPATSHRHDEAQVPYDGNVAALREACNKEINKITVLKSELGQTVNGLSAERDAVSKSTSLHGEAFTEADRDLRYRLSPALAEAQKHYSALFDQRQTLREKADLAKRLAELRLKRVEIKASADKARVPKEKRRGISPLSLHRLSANVEQLLQEWNFPFEGHVSYDETLQDLVIGPRRRRDQGKGLRALTHAAFTIGLQFTCRDLDRPHPGFVVLDSPLVTFRPADASESGTEIDSELSPEQRLSVKHAFYADLADRAGNDQIIIVENEDPDDALRDRIVCHKFTKNISSGRYGFFPVSGLP